MGLESRLVSAAAGLSLLVSTVVADPVSVPSSSVSTDYLSLIRGAVVLHEDFKTGCVPFFDSSSQDLVVKKGDNPVYFERVVLPSGVNVYVEDSCLLVVDEYKRPKSLPFHYLVFPRLHRGSVYFHVKEGPKLVSFNFQSVIFSFERQLYPLVCRFGPSSRSLLVYGSEDRGFLFSDGKDFFVYDHSSGSLDFFLRRWPAGTSIKVPRVKDPDGFFVYQQGFRPVFYKLNFGNDDPKKSLVRVNSR